LQSPVCSEGEDGVGEGEDGAGEGEDGAGEEVIVGIVEVLMMVLVMRVSCGNGAGNDGAGGDGVGGEGILW
jgi:hypothetical protein